MLNALIDSYHKKTKALESAISADDVKAVYAIDKDLTELWDKLLEHEPVDANERKILAEFLFEFLLPADQMSGGKKSAKLKLLSLLADDD